MEFRTIKHAVTVVIMLTTIGLAACSGKADTVDVDKDELASMKDKYGALATATAEQRETLYNIMRQLDEIADDAFALGEKRKHSGRAASRKTVDRIKYKLATIQTELDAASKKTEENPALQAQIAELRQQIDDQTTYLDFLLSEVSRKKSTLRQKYDELAHTKVELTQKQAEYENTQIQLQQQQGQLQKTIQNSWMAAGDKLMACNDNLNLLRNSGKMARRSREAKKRIIRQAITCYEAAAKEGHPMARQKILQAEAKLQNLN